MAFDKEEIGQLNEMFSLQEQRFQASFDRLFSQTSGYLTGEIRAQRSDIYHDISQLFDQKLDKALAPIHQKLDDFSIMHNEDITVAYSDIEKLQNAHRRLKHRITRLESIKT